MTRELRTIVSLLILALLFAASAGAQPSGTMTWGIHVTMPTRWLDTSETESEISPFMVLYALHDALVKPMPGNLNAPSLAESWSTSKDGRTWEFVLRKGARFHNGEPVTAEDVKFSFERYRGTQAPLFKARVLEVQAIDPSRVRFQLKDP
jgi:peptide/nickel transport system substrate-binding protein